MSAPVTIPNNGNSSSSYYGGRASRALMSRISLFGRSPGHKVNSMEEDDSTTLTSSQIREQTLSHTWKEYSLGSSLIKSGRNSPTIVLGESPGAYRHELSAVRNRGSTQRNSSLDGRASFDSGKSSIDDRYSNIGRPRFETSFEPTSLFSHDETDESDAMIDPSATTTTHPVQSLGSTSRVTHYGTIEDEQHEGQASASVKTPALPMTASGDDSDSISSSADTIDFIRIGVSEIEEQIPLLYTIGDLPPFAWFTMQIQNLVTYGPKNIASVSVTGLKSIPAVVLGLLLNILDAMAYGIIMFPASDMRIPASGTSSGISIFLASTIVAQVVYTFGGSGFKGVNGSMMIEVIPFLHIMVRAIEARISPGENTQHELMATIMAAYTISTLLTAIAFLLLGFFKLGNVIQFFPRHILVGCIGGIGLFLVQTGVEVTTGIKPSFSWDYMRAITMPYAIKLWGTAFCLAIGLKLVQKRLNHPLFVPLFCMAVPLFFYAIVGAMRIPLAKLRTEGWLFDLPIGDDDSFATFWSYFDFRATRWDCLPGLLPTMCALTFFGLLHIPINVPALAVSTHQDADINKELIGHGVSNLLSGMIGTTQNYLVYSNSVLFHRSGGNSRIAEILLTFATAAIWMSGDKIISFVPTIVIGTLIFHLGIDLLKEALCDSYFVGIHSLEYLTIVLIVLTMGFFGFTEGIVVGIIFACIFFVVMYAGKPVIRSYYTGNQLRSTVHRLYVHQQFLDKVGEQIRVLKLQGFIFFGSINQLDDYLRGLLHDIQSKVKFVVLDFALISDIDYSAMEAFLRIKKTLRDRNIHLVFCGLGSVGKELASVGVVDRNAGDWVHVFGTLNPALEWCENVLLSSYYKRTERARKNLLKRAAEELKDSSTTLTGPAGQGETRASSSISVPVRRVDSFTSASLAHASPRQKEVYEAANQILSTDPLLSASKASLEIHPVELLIRAFSDVPETSRTALQKLAPLFERTAVGPHGLMWAPHDDSTELLIIESGELLLEYVEANHEPAKFVETFIPGVMIGELEMFAGRPRTSRVRAGKAGAVLWRLRSRTFDEVCENEPSMALSFMKLALGLVGVRFYTVIAHAFHAMD